MPSEAAAPPAIELKAIDKSFGPVPCQHATVG
jgi:hypothetical protein